MLEEPLEKVGEQRAQRVRRVKLVPVARGRDDGRGRLHDPGAPLDPQHRVGVQRSEESQRQRAFLVNALGEHRHEPLLPPGLAQDRVRVSGRALDQAQDQFQHPRAHLALLALLQESKQETRGGGVDNARYPRGGRSGDGLEQGSLGQLNGSGGSAAGHRGEETTGRVFSRGPCRGDGYPAKGGRF